MAAVTDAQDDEQEPRSVETAWLSLPAESRRVRSPVRDAVPGHLQAPRRARATVTRPLELAAGIGGSRKPRRRLAPLLHFEQQQRRDGPRDPLPQLNGAALLGRRSPRS